MCRFACISDRWSHPFCFSSTVGRKATHKSALTHSHSIFRKTGRRKYQNAASIGSSSLYLCTSVFKPSWVCVTAHMCVYHDASPQLSHSFPATSRGWKRMKPQTTGAPQPIRIVYLASHGRLAEQEHTASHTALQGTPLLSCFPSFSTCLNFTSSMSSSPHATL